MAQTGRVKLPRISDNLFWTVPFMEIAARHVKGWGKLRCVKSRRPALGKRTGCYAVTTHYPGGYYGVMLNTHIVRPEINHKTQKVRCWKRHRFTPLEFLVTLAHELAHIDHWEHTPDHKALESLLMAKFTKRLKNIGYTSDEDWAHTDIFGKQCVRRKLFR